MSWFNVDKAGLAAVLERRGKSFAVFELVQNAWDSGATAVAISLTPIDGVPFALLTAEDDSAEGWADLDDSFTMFGRSRRANDPVKRGRFCLGEKLVLAASRRAVINTMSGTVTFDDKGRRRSGDKRERGTRVECEIRMTREELADALASIARLIPPVPTTINGGSIQRPKLLATFKAKLPTEIADADGNLRRSMRDTTVEVFESDGSGDILEMGVPVTDAEWPWRLNVHQKVPLGMERDSVTDAFRRALQVAAVNAMADKLSEDEVSKPWVQEAAGDSRALPATVNTVVTKQFGERRVMAVPNDPIANATAAAKGYTVIYGGSCSSDLHANIRKHGIVVSSSAAFPTPTAEDRAKAIDAMPDACPLCGQAMKAS